MNQCDGCKLGLPIDESGIHYHPDKKGYGRLHMVCERRLYEESRTEAEVDEEGLDA